MGETLLLLTPLGYKECIRKRDRDRNCSSVPLVIHPACLIEVWEHSFSRAQSQREPTNTNRWASPKQPKIRHFPVLTRKETSDSSCQMEHTWSKPEGSARMPVRKSSGFGRNNSKLERICEHGENEPKGMHLRNFHIFKSTQHEAC